MVEIADLSSQMACIPSASRSAELSNTGPYTVFKAGDECLTFAAPYSLERYVDVLEWDAGYLVVTAKYSHSEEPVEEYIDLLPVLENLLIDPEPFLSSIDSVEVRYDRCA